MIHSLSCHWRTYFMEAACLAIFMISASLFGTILEYPGSVVNHAIPDQFLRRCVMGFAMGLTATLIIYSPAGKRSGAHMNPAVTIAFLIMGKINRNDAIFYTIFQCLGGIIAVGAMATVIGDPFKEQHVNYIITAPGAFGVVAAFAVEVVISFCMMIMVLATTNHSSFSGYTGIFAGFFVMMYVIISGPISGFSMNPARTLASAVPSGLYPSLWIYMTAPFLGMISATWLFRKCEGKAVCAKLYHSDHYMCIFNCGYCRHQSITDVPVADTGNSNKS